MRQLLDDAAAQGYGVQFAWNTDDVESGLARGGAKFPSLAIQLAEDICTLRAGTQATATADFKNFGVSFHQFGPVPHRN